MGDTQREIILRELGLKVDRNDPDLIGLQEVSQFMTGDPYSSSPTDTSQAANHVVLDYLQILQEALHAKGLGFTHPVTGETLHFTSPLPEDIAVLCDFLREQQGGSAID